MSERERAVRALSAWRAVRPWARRDPAELDIVEVIACGPAQVILESIYEARGVEYSLRAAPTRPDVQDRGPDPWSVRLEHDEPPMPQAQVRAAIENLEVHMDCGMCSATGEMTCPRCNGSGRVSSGGHGAGGSSNRSAPCPRCRGRAVLKCGHCRGSGGLLGSPTVWSRIERHEQLRVHEPKELPLDVYLHLQDSDVGGEVIHEQEDERVVDLRRQTGYRDAASVDDPLRQLVQDVGAAHGVPNDGRILRQRLEVRRVPAWELKLASGERVWVYGDPPSVWPKRALATVAFRVAHAAPYLAGAIALLASGLWLASG